MPSRAWMATSSTGAISALTTRATSDPTLCRAVGIEAAAADHDPDPEADDHALDQVVVADHDEGKNLCKIAIINKASLFAQGC